MKKYRLLYPTIPAILMSITYGYLFITKGYHNGTEHWKFYASLIGFMMISSITVFAIYKITRKIHEKPQKALKN